MHFPRYWPFRWGIHRSPVNSLKKGQWRGALIFSLICAWTNDWVNIETLVIWGASALIMTSQITGVSTVYSTVFFRCRSKKTSKFFYLMSLSCNIVTKCMLSNTVINYQTQWGQVTHIWGSQLDRHWFKLWLVAYSAPRHGLNQGWIVVI